MANYLSNLSDILWPGTRIYVTAVENLQRMLSAAVTVNKEYVAITVPSKDGYFHPLAKGAKVEVSFFSGSGKYSFNSIVSKRVLMNNYPVILLDFPKRVDRAERRQHYRMDTLFPIKVIISEITGEGEDLKVTLAEHKTKCADISAGGLMLDPISSRAIPIISGMQMEIDFLQALDGLSRAWGVAVRPPRSEVDGWGIKFNDLTEANRARIARYVNKKQIESHTEKKKEADKKKLHRLTRRR